MPQRLISSIIEKQTILACSAQLTVSEAADLMKKSDFGAIVVTERGRLVGIFTERDALTRVIAQGRDPRSTQLTEVMTRNPQTIDPNKQFGHALHMMYEGGFRHVPVVSNGKPVGMISARDVLGPELEDFVAEVRRREHILEILG
ncbi:MAG: CBS domain-containing protein [Betaproteobacteria bacterium]|nr:CBS domain-containing protein [Betaproteobacteria bacterium]